MKLKKQTGAVIVLAIISTVSIFSTGYVYQTTQTTARTTAATISEQQEKIAELTATLDKQSAEIETLKTDLETAKLNAQIAQESLQPDPAEPTLEERLDAILNEQPSSNGTTTAPPTTPKPSGEYNPDEWSPRPDNPDNIDEGKMGEISGRHDNPFS